MVGERLSKALEAIGLSGPLTARDLNNLQNLPFVTGVAGGQGIDNAGMVSAAKLSEILGSNWKARLVATDGLRYAFGEALFATGSPDLELGVIFDTEQLKSMRLQKQQEERLEGKAAGINAF